jgi:hypothetical protein
MRARTVCAAYYARAYALPPPVGMRELAAYPEKQQALREQRLAGLRGLHPPASQRAAYARYISAMARLDAIYAKAISDIESPNPRAARALAKGLGPLGASLESQARALGLDACAANPYSATHYANSSGNGR